jgi:hypothetical protein
MFKQTLLAKKKRFLIAILLCGALLPGLVPTTALAKAVDNGGCTIILGEDGKDYPYNISSDEFNELLADSGSKTFKTKPSRFIRSTTGFCKFTVYNKEGANENGWWVSLGTDLSDKIRAGEGGVDGTGDTWKIRSLVITPVADADRTCPLRIGGNGRRMVYFNGQHPRVPAMNRIEQFAKPGDHCRLNIYANKDYSCPSKPFETPPCKLDLRGRSYTKPAWDPKFRVRSLKIDMGQ